MREALTIREERGADVPEARENGPYVIASALRTLQVLRSFAEPPYRFGLADVMAKLGLEKNQAYRSLKTLEAAGFLTATADARFTLGPAAAELRPLHGRARRVPQGTSRATGRGHLQARSRRIGLRPSLPISQYRRS